MAALSWDEAWKRFATPAERALAAASRNVSDDLALDIIERARLAGVIIRFPSPTKRKARRRGRR